MGAGFFALGIQAHVRSAFNGAGEPPAVRPPPVRDEVQGMERSDGIVEGGAPGSREASGSRLPRPLLPR